MIFIMDGFLLDLTVLIRIIVRIIAMLDFVFDLYISMY